MACQWDSGSKNVLQDGPCGTGLHLALSIEEGLQYARFPFRILKVKPLSPILDQDNSKIRVAKAESLGEISIPKWAMRLENRIAKLPEEIKAIPWYKGSDTDRASHLIRSHFKLLVPWGFKLDFEVEIETNWAAASAAAWTANGAAANATIWAVAGAAASAAASAAAGAIVRDIAWAAVRDAAWTTIRDITYRVAAEDATRAVAGDAVWVAAGDVAGDIAGDVAWDIARDTVKYFMKERNPFDPLWKVWKLGFWPIGFVGNKFILFSEKAKP